MYSVDGPDDDGRVFVCLCVVAVASGSESGRSSGVEADRVRSPVRETGSRTSGRFTAGVCGSAHTGLLPETTAANQSAFINMNINVRFIYRKWR